MLSMITLKGMAVLFEQTEYPILIIVTTARVIRSNSMNKGQRDIITNQGIDIRDIDAVVEV
jgi:hypothetical protein